VLEALFKRETAFTRTPKTGAEGKVVRAPIQRSYLGRRSLTPMIELAFGLYFTGAVIFAAAKGIWTSLPFLVIFQVGYLYVGWMSFFQGRFRTAPQAVAGPAVDLRQAA
jgi:hypothetical protein